VQLLKESDKLKETVKSHNEQLSHHEETIEEIQKKITKEPRVFSGQTFVS
jgi:predicted  nucleic acid-binding Zn-ribbon protein